MTRASRSRHKDPYDCQRETIYASTHNLPSHKLPSRFGTLHNLDELALVMQ